MKKFGNNFKTSFYCCHIIIYLIRYTCCLEWVIFDRDERKTYRKYVFEIRNLFFHEVNGKMS